MYERFTIQLMSVGFIILLIAAAVFFLLTLQNTLKAISPENRKMEPGAVWRMFIPFYNYFFAFVMVQKIADSISLQLESSGQEAPESKPTYNWGLLWAIFLIGNIICNLLKLSDLTSLSSLGATISFIFYWSKMAFYKKQIKRHPEITLDIEKEENFILKN